MSSFNISWRCNLFCIKYIKVHTDLRILTIFQQTGSEYFKALEQ